MQNPPDTQNAIFFEAIKPRIVIPREEALRDVAKQLKVSDRFVALLGESGSGKTFFLNKQLESSAEYLADDEKDWRIISLCPEINPIGILADKLAEPGKLKAKNQVQPFYRFSVEETLREGGEGLVKVYENALKQSEKPFKLLVIVDQLEEMFRYLDHFIRAEQNPADNQKFFFQPGDDTLFFSLFLNALEAKTDIYVIFSINSETIDRMNRYPSWPQRISIHRYRLEDITVEKITEALGVDHYLPNLVPTTPPSGNKPLEELYRRLSDEYQELYGTKTELIARLNLSLASLHQRSRAILPLPFLVATSGPKQSTEINKLLNIPEKLLAEMPPWYQMSQEVPNAAELQQVWKTWWEQNIELKTSPEQKPEPELTHKLERRKLWFTWSDELVKQLTLSESAAKKRWGNWLENCEEATKKAFTTAVVSYFESLNQYAEKNARISNAYDTTASNIYYNFGEKGRLLCTRLFQGVTRKDSSSVNVAIKNPTTYNVLLNRCVRDGSEYANHLKKLGGHSYSEDPPVKNDPGHESLFKTVVEAFLVPYGDPKNPSLLRRINPSGSVNASGEKDDIIDVSGSALINEWSPLTDWVEEEYRSSNLYKRLVERAIEYFSLKLSEPKSIGRTKRAKEVPPTPSFFKDLWSELLGYKDLFVEEGDRTTKKGSNGDPAKEKQERSDQDFSSIGHNDQKLPVRAEEQLLSEGMVELTEQWLVDATPNEYWGGKYADKEVEIKGEIIKDDLSKETVTEKKTTFTMVIEYFGKSKAYRDGIKEEKINSQKEKIKKFRKFSKVIAWLLAFSLVASIIAIISWNNARIDKRNTNLLNFISTLSRIDAIPANTYRSEEYQALKRSIRDNKDIKHNEDVLHFLGDGAVLQFKKGEGKDFHTEISKAALIQSNDLVGSLKELTEGVVIGLANEALEKGKTALAYSADTSFQYPYVYHNLLENIYALRADKNKQTSTEIEALESNLRLLEEIFYNSSGKVNAIAANPQNGNEIGSTLQLVIGGVGGQIVVFQNGKVARSEELGKSISDVMYSADGSKLYVSTFTGELYRFSPMGIPPLKSSIKGQSENLEKLSPIEVVREDGKPLPILDLLPTAQSNSLILQEDGGIGMIELNEDQSAYQLVGDLNWEKEGIKTVNLIVGNPESTKLLIGGINTSIILEVSLVAEEPFSIVGKINHPQLSVTSIAFEKQAAAPLSTGRIAIGTQTGEIFLVDLNQASSNQIDLVRDPSVANFQSAAVTDLVFSRQLNNQLISSSEDGTVWIFNTDLIGPVGLSHQLNEKNEGYNWDALMFKEGGRSINMMCLVNAEELIVVEGNVLKPWLTHLKPLTDELSIFLERYKSKRK